MTFYEVAIADQHTACEIAAKMIAYLDNPADRIPCFERLMREYIDRAYVLGEMIDDMAPELAEREV